ncbi:MAG: DUF3179 domain-containing protein [Pseudonocardiaceae bacterium]
MDDPPRAAPNRRQVLKGAGVLGGLAIAGGLTWQALAGGDAPRRSAPTGGANSQLDALADSVVSGGPGKDGIPSIDKPRLVSADEAAFVQEDEPVFGLERGGEVRAYPQLVLVWHEIVNDTVGGEPLSITYCPLTGTVIGFAGLAARPNMTFGTTGRLVNSNLLMYDRETDSEWPQVLGTAISGDLKGARLRTVPLVWSTWKAWRTQHPDTRVLSTDTGHLRDYGSDPYGSYPNQSGYYAGGGPIFPVRHTDDRFPPKDVVVGVRHGDAQLAVHRELVRHEKTVEATVGGLPIRAVWDDKLDTARVVRGDGGEQADFLDAMWFAWYAFYPDTEVMS